jgi:hypothetical protein
MTLLPNVNFAAIALALLLANSLVHPANAEEATTFVIAAASGYGVEDCLGEGGECGRVVADAWCEAHGRGAALEFGQQAGSDRSVQPKPYFITCGN